MHGAIVTDKHLRQLAHLDPTAIINPETIEDWNTCEHNLYMGYPLTGPGAPRYVKLTWRQIFGSKTWREVLE